MCGGALLAPVHVITYLNSNDSLYIYINFNIDPASSIEELALKKLGARCIHIVLHFIHYFFRSSAFCLAMGWVGWDFCPLQRGLSIHPTHPRQKAGVLEVHVLYGTPKYPILTHFNFRESSVTLGAPGIFVPWEINSTNVLGSRIDIAVLMIAPIKL